MELGGLQKKIVSFVGKYKYMILILVLGLVLMLLPAVLLVW